MLDVSLELQFAVGRNWNLLLDQALDVSNVSALLGGCHRDGVARFASSTGTTDPVDIVLGIVGQVVVDDESDLLYVDSTGGDVSRNQYAVFTALETFESSTSLSEGAIGVKFRR